MSSSFSICTFVPNLQKIRLKLKVSWGGGGQKNYKNQTVTMALVFTPQPLRAVGVLFSPMVFGWAGGRVAGKSLSGLYLRNCKV